MLERLHGRFGQVDRTQLREWGYRYGNAIVRDALAITAARRRKWPWPEDLAAAAQVLESPAPVCPFGGRGRARTRDSTWPASSAPSSRGPKRSGSTRASRRTRQFAPDILERAMAASLAK